MQKRVASLLLPAFSQRTAVFPFRNVRLEKVEKDRGGELKPRIVPPACSALLLHNYSLARTLACSINGDRRNSDFDGRKEWTGDLHLLANLLGDEGNS